MKKSAVVSVILAAAMMSCGAWAQGSQASAQPQAQPGEHKSEAHFFHLKLVVEQVNGAGKIENARKYETTVAATIPRDYAPQSIRTGARVPIVTAVNAANPSAAEFQYIDVGVSFDVREAREVGNMLGFRLVADISSIAKQGAEGQTSLHQPVIRQNKWDSQVLIPVDKPTVVFSGDDLDDTGKMQVEVTATRVE